jgi:hypothetical protein
VRAIDQPATPTETIGYQQPVTLRTQFILGWDKGHAGGTARQIIAVILGPEIQ